ncbi:hypothetical protein Q5762_02105 [Streptomyces sp. P9(2023)]|nr:hypothetical protein [Streptomyces sp. P9(2023)]MDT9687160.1 hypothetical protein [Streptomyces sp. P9(2023)]
MSPSLAVMTEAYGEEDTFGPVDGRERRMPTRGLPLAVLTP